MPSRRLVFDCIVLLAVSLIAEAAAFSTRVGRATVCTDSFQYVAAAEALRDPDQTPHFEMRKPGYPLFLAGVKLAFGHLGWAAIAGNHALLLFLPLAVYGLGIHLHSRLLGWIAAILTMVQLQTIPIGNWMMSEALYAFLLAFGVLVFIVGLGKTRAALWLAAAGLILGLAWMTRGVAAAIIPVALIAVGLVYRQNRRRAMALSAAFVLPVIGMVGVECSLNYTFAGQFRLSNGTAGAAMLTQRMRAFQGAEMPNTKEGERLAKLLPERGAEDIFVGSVRDQWVARYRAVKTEGWSGWEFDDLCRRVAVQSIRSEPMAFIRTSAGLALRHLLRDGGGMSHSPLPKSTRRGFILHPAAPTVAEGEENWDAYWSLPHLPLDESIQLVDRIKTEASTRAPLEFDGSGVWSALRYWKSKPTVTSALNALNRLGGLWPGFALLLCGFLRLNRTTCLVLAAMYVTEAVLLSAVTVTDTRYQSVWLVTDTTLAAALPVALLAEVARQLRARLAVRRAVVTRTCGKDLS